MNQNNFTVSIGIPAYNEEANIKSLIENLLSQKESGFKLKEIIVASDGSSDQTEEIVQSFTDPRVQLIADGKREGQAARQNQIIERFGGDVLVLLNGDVLPENDEFLRNITNPFHNIANIGVISGKPIPVAPDNFFEKIINSSVNFKYYLVGKINNGNNIYNCHGSVRAFSKKFADIFRWPGIVSEDAYSYLMCKKNGFTFVFEPAARVYRKSPQNLRDHVKQSGRFIQGQKDLTKAVPAEVVKAEHHIPAKYLISALIAYFVKHPVLMVSYVLITIYTKILSVINKNYAVLKWDPASTSKNLSQK